jgi:hypothetical protein
MFGISRQDIINDDLSALTDIPRRIGRGGALKLNDIFWATFMANSSFFTSGRNNYISGATTTLDTVGMTAALKAFRDQVDADGKPLGLQPAILLVPNALEVAAKQLMVASEVRDTTANKVSTTANVFAGQYRPFTSSYLGNANYTGNSALAWYLLANPMDAATMEVAFLNGQESPTVETAQADMNVLGIQLRGYHDFGCALADYRAGVKSKGAA